MSRKTIYQDQRFHLVAGIDFSLGSFLQLFDQDMAKAVKEGYYDKFDETATDTAIKDAKTRPTYGPEKVADWTARLEKNGVDHAVAERIAKEAIS